MKFRVQQLHLQLDQGSLLVWRVKVLVVLTMVKRSMTYAFIGQTSGFLVLLEIYFEFRVVYDTGC